MNITLNHQEVINLTCGLELTIREMFASRHRVDPEWASRTYRAIRELIAICRKADLARVRDLDRVYQVPRCKDMADLRRRNAIRATRKRIQRDAASLKFTPLQKAA